MCEPLQLELFDCLPEFIEPDRPPGIYQKCGSFIDNMKLPIHRWFRYSAGFSALWVEEAIAPWQNML